jgi:hypothetical protein
MKLDWRNLKSFVSSNSLYNFLNYVDMPDNYYIWVAYQNENFYTILDKGSVDCEDFEKNFKPKAILKQDMAPDGQRVTKITHILAGRLLKALFTVMTTSTKTHNDVTGYISIKLYDENGSETNVGANAVKTCIDFQPNFDYEIYGGGLSCLSDIVGDFYVSAIVAPAIPSEQGGTVYNVINKKILSPRESIFIAGVGTAEIKYNAQVPVANVMRIAISHGKGVQQSFQVELQYYSDRTIVQ